MQGQMLPTDWLSLEKPSIQDRAFKVYYKRLPGTDNIKASYTGKRQLENPEVDQENDKETSATCTLTKEHSTTSKREIIPHTSDHSKGCSV